MIEVDSAVDNNGQNNDNDNKSQNFHMDSGS